VPGPRATRITVSPTVRKQLLTLSRSATAAHRLVERAEIILLAARGLSNAHISAVVRCTEKTARKWRDRFRCDPTKRALKDAERSGRPATITVATRCELVKLACARPDDHRAAFRDVWTLGTLRDALEAQSGVHLSVSEVGRILRSDGLRPHRLKMWLHSPDPNFRERVERICELYCRVPTGATVVCIDEKTGMQALGRKHPTKRPRPGVPGRFEFEYIRNGTQALIAAFDVRTGHVFGHCRDRRTADDLDQFMEALALRYPRAMSMSSGTISTPTAATSGWSSHVGTAGAFTSCTRRSMPRGSTRSKSGSASCIAACSSTASSRRWRSCANASRASSIIGTATKPTRFAGPSEVSSRILNRSPPDGATAMPKLSAESYDADTVDAFLCERGFRGMRARRRADLVTIESGPAADPYPHARLRRVTAHLWRLEIATHSGRWEITPCRGGLDELLRTLVENFPWTIQPIE